MDLTWFFILSAVVPLVFMPQILFNIFAAPQVLALGSLSAVGVTLGVAFGAFSLATPSLLSFLFLAYITLSIMWMRPVHNARKEYGLQAPLIIVFLLGAVYLNTGNVKWVALAYTITTLLEIVYCYFQTKRIDPFFPNRIKGGGSKTNPIGTIGNPNFTGAFFATAFWICIYTSITVSYYLLLVAVATLFIMYKTGSSSSVLGLTASSLFFLLVILHNNEFIFNVIIAILILLVPFIYVMFKANWWTFWHKPVGPHGAKQVWYLTLRYRFCYWWAAWELIKEKPIFGWGMWSFRKEVYRAQAEIHSKKWDGFMKDDRYLTPQPRECHNDYIEHLVEFGIVGTVLFMAFLGTVYYAGFAYLAVTTGADFVLMLILMSGLTSAVAISVFFFSLRLLPTALLFWILCAMIIGISGAEVQTFAIPVYIPIFVLLFCSAAVYYCAFKRCMASYYFNVSRTHEDDNTRSRALEKALHWAPSDTLLRTHAALGVIDFEPTISNMHVSRLLEDYDGQAPLWATLFNAGMCRARTKNLFEEATIYLNNSHFINPYFVPSRDLLFAQDGVGVRGRYIGGPRHMVIVGEDIKWRIHSLVEMKKNSNLIINNIDASRQQLLQMLEQNKPTGMEEENFKLKVNICDIEKQRKQLEIQLADATMMNVLVSEKKRLNVPDNWFYDKEQGHFVGPAEAQERDLIPEKRPPGMDDNPYLLKAKEEPKKEEDGRETGEISGTTDVGKQ